MGVIARLQAFGRGVLWVWDHSIGWVLMWILIAPILAYRLVISPVMPPTCRFHPSCSSYAFGSIRAHGSAKGLALAVWRLLRCNPWNGGGVDPVPSPGKWRPDVYSDGRPR